MLTFELKNQIREYATEFLGEEVGGVLIEREGTINFFPCQNLSYHKENHYILSYLDYIKAEKYGKIIAQVHSQENDFPSIVDNLSAHSFNLYSIIYCWKNDKFFIIKPELKGYLNKDFEIGKNDCFTLVQEYYKQELGIIINNYKREENWYLEKPTIIYDNFSKEGFVIVFPEDCKLHDILLFGKNRNELYHMGIFQENNLFLHHSRDSKSCIEDLNHLWKNKLILTLRHKSLL